VRLDSGDLGALAFGARRLLDEAGLPQVAIFASGDLDERRIRDLIAAGAPIDGFGVGTELITSRDAPALAMVYKLVELAGKGRMKLSVGKKTYPLAKQVWRRLGPDGRMAGDLVAWADETVDRAEPLLTRVVQGGVLTVDLPDVHWARARCSAQLATLPEALRDLDRVHPYPVAYSGALEDEARGLGVRVG
jgi:nicotinate phosphoribosyltransferase